MGSSNSGKQQHKAATEGTRKSGRTDQIIPDQGVVGRRSFLYGLSQRLMID